MSENVEIRRGESIASLVEELAASVTEDSLTLPADRAIGEGEWVAFTVRLADGTDVMEGVGRSRGSMPRGNPVSHHDLVLEQLQFDERNEIMWERLLIAAESVESGEETGTIQLGEGSMEAVEASAGATPPKLPPRPSAPPPPAQGLGRPSQLPSKPPPPSKPLPSSKPPSPSKPPAARQPAASKPSAESGSASGRPSLSRVPSLSEGASSPVPSSPPLPSSPARASSPPKSPSPPATSGGAPKPAGSAPHRFDVPVELRERARQLSADLPRGAVGTGAASPGEDAVLLTALRMGLAALEAQRESKR